MRGLQKMAFQDHSLHFSSQHLQPEREVPTPSKLSPQVLIPKQFATTVPISNDDGVVALMSAVLEDAVQCFRKQFVSGKRRDHRLAKEAEDWFLSESDTSPFSFDNICTVLRLDPDCIRARLQHRSQSSWTQTEWKTHRQIQRRQPLRFAR